MYTVLNQCTIFRFMPSVEIFSCKFNCSFNSPIFNRLFNILEINKAFKLDFHIFVIYQVIASHLQTFRAVLTTNEKQQGYQSTISDIDRTRRNCQETVETAKPSNNSPRESDFESFNYEQAIAEILLELRENFKTSAAATCFASEKIKYVLDRQIHMKILIKYLRKDIEDAAPPSNIVFSYEMNAIISSQSPFPKSCNKFSDEKSLLEYPKRCDSFLELSLGFNAKMQKADTIQFVLLYKDTECSS